MKRKSKIAAIVSDTGKLGGKSEFDPKYDFAVCDT
jgi:hypothetical protein